MRKLFAVVTFPEEQDKVAVVPLSWLTEDRVQCHWPPKRRGVRVEELVRDRVDATAVWQKYPVCLVTCCSTFEKAERRATGAQYGLAADTTEQSVRLVDTNYQVTYFVLQTYESRPTVRYASKTQFCSQRVFYI
ncbi:hypothetical protein MRX96_037565 [Rhipicephalus microplus]